MNKTVNAAKSEFLKLAVRKKYLILLILSAAICFLRYGGAILIERLSEGYVTIKSNIMLEMLPVLTEIIVPLVVFMSVTDLISGEIHDDSIKAVLMKPMSRFKVLTAKVFAAFEMGLVYMGSIFLVCFAIQAYTGSNTLGLLVPSLAAYIIDAVPMFCVVLLAAVINMLATGPTLAMLLCVGVYAFMKYANYFSGIGRIFFTGYLGWHKLWLGNTIISFALLSNLMIILSTVLIFYTLSYILFERKEF